MKNYLLRMIVLLVAFSLGIAVSMLGRYSERGGVARIDDSDQKPFVLVIRKRARGTGSNAACH